MNPVLARLLSEREHQTDYIDELLARVQEEGRDLVATELQMLEAARERCQELDTQIAALEEHERLLEEHRQRAARLPAPPEPRRPPGRDGDEREPRSLGGDRRPPAYRSAGAFMVDLIRARGVPAWGLTADPDAQTRVVQARALENQTTADTPGLLPEPIVGQVVNLIDANRPLITSVGGARPMANIPGQKFSRPKITQHVIVGQQTAEKTQLPSRKMTINPVEFTKETWGGSVDVSRQDIDWTDPAAWDILIGDLADVYAIESETAVATGFAASVSASPVEVSAGTDLQAWVTALYQAAAQSYQAGKRMPDRIWCSLDVWAALGSLVDQRRVVLLPAMGDQAPGTQTLASFFGDMLGVPRIVVPTFEAGTCIIGPSSLFEVYEQVIGLLSAVEPSILGVEVAYGGYVAAGTLAAEAFVSIEAADLPPVVEPEPEQAPAPTKANSTAKAASSASGS